MLGRLRAAGLIWPSILATLGLIVLITLGTWQWNRKTWKDALQAQIAARATATPVDLAAAVGLWTASGLAGAEYLRVRVSGQFRNDLERAYYEPAPAGLGWHIYAPLMIADGRALWVNRGFVPDKFKSAASRGETAISAPVEVTGLLRVPAVPGTFTPDNDLKANIWYWRDLAGMHKSAFPTGQPQALPFFLEIEADKPPRPANATLPQPGVTNLDLSNRHLEYAITWWGLACTLIGVFLAFAHSRLKTRD